MFTSHALDVYIGTLVPEARGDRVYHLVDYVYHSNGMGETHLAATSMSGTLHFTSLAGQPLLVKGLARETTILRQTHF